VAEEEWRRRVEEALRRIAWFTYSTMRGIAKDNMYRKFTIDLTVARERESLGLRGLGIKARNMVVLKADSPFTIRINDPDADPLDASIGMEIDMEITEIFITNKAGTGVGELIVTWRM